MGGATVIVDCAAGVGRVPELSCPSSCSVAEVPDVGSKLPRSPPTLLTVPPTPPPKVRVGVPTRLPTSPITSPGKPPELPSSPALLIVDDPDELFVVLLPVLLESEFALLLLSELLVRLSEPTCSERVDVRLPPVKCASVLDREDGERVDLEVFDDACL